MSSKLKTVQQSINEANEANEKITYVMGDNIRKLYTWHKDGQRDQMQQGLIPEYIKNTHNSTIKRQRIKFSNRQRA